MSEKIPANDPTLRSFVPVAADSHFPIQNLPFGVFRRRDHSESHVGVAIGDMVLDLDVASRHGLLARSNRMGWFFQYQLDLNAFMSMDRSDWREARSAISQLLRHDEPILRDNASLRQQALIPQADVTMLLPAIIENYTDFYSSKEHATNVGTMLRGPENALNPNWVHLP